MDEINLMERKKKSSLVLPRNFIEQDELFIKHKNSFPIDVNEKGNFSIDDIGGNSINSTRERSYNQQGSEKKNRKKLKRVSFNPKVKIINIIKYKKETKKASYQCNYSDSAYEDDFNDETEKKCIICEIY